MPQFAIDELFTTGVRVSGFLADVGNSFGAVGEILKSSSSGVVWGAASAASSSTATLTGVGTGVFASGDFIFPYNVLISGNLVVSGSITDSALSVNQYVKTDSNKKLTTVSQIPASDVTGLFTHLITSGTNNSISLTSAAYNPGSGTVTTTIDTIQNITTGATPVFSTVFLSGQNANTILKLDANRKIVGVTSLATSDVTGLWSTLIFASGNTQNVTISSLGYNPSSGTVTITFDTSQDLRTGAIPVFSTAFLSGLNANTVLKLDSNKKITSVSSLAPSDITGLFSLLFATGTNASIILNPPLGYNPLSGVTTLTIDAIQDIRTGSTPVFSTTYLSGQNANTILKLDANRKVVGVTSLATSDITGLWNSLLFASGTNQSVTIFPLGYNPSSGTQTITFDTAQDLRTGAIPVFSTAFLSGLSISANGILKTNANKQITTVASLAPSDITGLWGTLIFASGATQNVTILPLGYNPSSGTTTITFDTSQDLRTTATPAFSSVFLSGQLPNTILKLDNNRKITGLSSIAPTDITGLFSLLFATGSTQGVSISSLGYNPLSGVITFTLDTYQDIRPVAKPSFSGIQLVGDVSLSGNYKVFAGVSSGTTGFSLTISGSNNFNTGSLSTGGHIYLKGGNAASGAWGGNIYLDPGTGEKTGNLGVIAFGALTSGKVGIGTDVPVTLFQIGSSVNQKTTNTFGLNFQGDSYLYRSAANTLKTDGNVTIAGLTANSYVKTDPTSTLVTLQNINAADVSGVFTGIQVASSLLVTNLNANFLSGKDSSFYTNLFNFTGTLPDGRLTGAVMLTGNQTIFDQKTFNGLITAFGSQCMHQNGTLNSPSIVFSGDTSFGFYFLNSNVVNTGISIVAGATRRLLITATGALGISHDTPTFNLDVSGNGRFSQRVKGLSGLAPDEFVTMNQLIATGALIPTASANGVPGTGFPNYYAKWTATTSLSTGSLWDNGTGVIIGNGIITGSGQGLQFGSDSVANLYRYDSGILATSANLIITKLSPYQYVKTSGSGLLVTTSNIPVQDVTGIFTYLVSSGALGGIVIVNNGYNPGSGTVSTSLDTVQDIRTGATPVFSSVFLSGQAAGSILKLDANRKVTGTFAAPADITGLFPLLFTSGQNSSVLISGGLGYSPLSGVVTIKLDTVQDIRTTSSPMFFNEYLTGSLNFGNPNIVGSSLSYLVTTTPNVGVNGSNVIVSGGNCTAIAVPNITGGNVYLFGGDATTNTTGPGGSVFLEPGKGNGGLLGAVVMGYLTTGRVGIGVTLPQYKLHVSGSFAATTKSFSIPHPTKENKTLNYGSLEGPEHGVFIRGKSFSPIIELPDYWIELIDKDTITVNITPFDSYQNLYVRKIEDNKVYIASDSIECSYYYTVYAERKDVEKLKVET